jgi:molybdenum cofactor guanylyltransferase
MSVTAIIVAGGRGSRMGGSDKGLQLLYGKPLIVHVLSRLVPQVDSILINANREIPAYQGLGYPVLSDEMPDFAGPLAGFALGFKHAESEYLLTVPCDCPLLPVNLREKLQSALEQAHAEIAIATSHGSDHPVVSLCKTSMLGSLQEYLAQGGRKVSDWQKSLHHVYVDVSDVADAFININTPQDLKQLEAKQHG